MKNRVSIFSIPAGLPVLLGLCWTTNLGGGATIAKLPTLGGPTLEAKAINRAGQVAGFSTVVGGDQHGFLYSGGVSHDLWTLGGITSASFGLNQSGWVVGESGLSDGLETHAFLFNGTKMVDLGTLGGTFSTASAVNERGQVVGIASLAGDRETHAFLFDTNGILRDLGTLGVGRSFARDINNRGQVVGDSTDASGKTIAFLWQDGIMTGLTLGGISFGYAINDAGQVVGESYGNDSEDHGFLYSAGTVADLGTLGGTYSVAYALNEAGQVIGDSTTADDLETHGFIHTAGVMSDLGTLGGPFTTAHAINNLGQVVGDSTDANYNSIAFFWQNGIMYDLNGVLPPNSGWTLQTAWYLNDVGQIVGTGMFQGNYAWYILTLGQANHPPVADAGADQTVECGAAARLDGRGSTDPDGDALVYEWSEGDTKLGTEAQTSVTLGMGVHTLTLTATDRSGASSQDTVVVTVKDTTPPLISCPAAQTASPNANCLALVPDLLAGLVAQDTCTPSRNLVKSQVPAAGTPVGTGTHEVTITVTDVASNTATCTTTFKVAETNAPTIQSASVTPSNLSPANRRMIPVTVSVVAVDDCDPAPKSRIVSIVSSEPVTSQGDRTSPDWRITGPLTAQLRAERSKGNVPRIYTLTVACTDASGNTTRTTLTVGVHADRAQAAASSKVKRTTVKK